jgi:hypothetical protein
MGTLGGEYMTDERRRYSRVTVEIDVEVSVQINRKCAGRVTDISESGLFVESSKHVEQGDFVVMKFTGQKILFGAIVRRVLTGRGFGAEFGRMNEVHRETISRYLKEDVRATVSSVVPLPTMMFVCDDGSYSFLSREFKEAGFAVLEVRSTEKIISSMESFDVVGIISEYIVGGKDTLSTLRKIKDKKRKLDFPVVLYSGRYDVPNGKFEEIGIQCFFKHNTPPTHLTNFIIRNSSKGQ